MHRLNKWLLAIPVILLVGTFVVINTQHQKSQTESMIEMHSQATAVLVVHEGKKQVLASHLHRLQERPLFLMLKQNNQYVFLSSLEQLVPFDHDQDGMIDQSDPIYSQLFIANYDRKKKHFNYQPLHRTAIRAINLAYNARSSEKYTAIAVLTNHHQTTSNYKIYIEPARFDKNELEKTFGTHAFS